MDADWGCGGGGGGRGLVSLDWEAELSCSCCWGRLVSRVVAGEDEVSAMANWLLSF